MKVFVAVANWRGWVSEGFGER